MQDSFNKYISGEKRAGLLALLALFLVLFFNPFDKSSESLLLSVIIILISFLSFPLWRRNKHRNILIPGVIWYFFFHMIGYGIVGFIEHDTGIGIYIGGKWVDSLTDESEIIAKRLVIYHLIIVLFSMQCLKYVFPDKKRLPKDLKHTFSNLEFKLCVLLCLFFVFLFMLRATNVIFFNNVTISLLAFIPFMYLFYILFFLNRGHWIFKIAAIIGCLIVRGVLDGPSIGPYAEIGLIYLIIQLHRGRIPIAPVGVLLLAFILYQPMKGPVRILMDQGNYAASDSFATGFDIIEGYDSFDLIDIASKRIDYNLLLTTFIDNIGVANSTDFKGWQAYENLPYTVIPRFILPSKPIDIYANSWAVDEGFLASYDYNTSYNLPWLPQMYLSFGTKGIIIGSFIVAFLLFFIERFYWTMQPNAWSFAIGYSIIRCFIHLESDFAMSFGLVIKLILVDIALRFIFKLLVHIKN